MDSYSAATSWILFGGVVAFGCWYYYPQQRKPVQQRNVEDASHATATRRKRTEKQEERGRPSKRPGAEHGSGSDVPSSKANGTLRKRKVPEPSQSVATPPVAVQAAEPEEDEMNTRRWAEGMLQAQKGHDIGSSSKSKEARVKTVKQSSARDSSQGGAEADDDLSPVRAPGDVSDMLEPAAKGPASLRITAPTKPQKERTPRAPKEEVVETKKQRQNRQKAEERRLERLAEEASRQKLEENQRRTAREARGEPAKNGIPVSKPPAVSAWVVSPTTSNDSSTAPTHAPLLDTFDADSISSSNGGPEPSTGPTSTTSAQWDHDLPSEEEQMAQAMKQSEDESGWTTVPSQHQKKSKKPTSTVPATGSAALGNKANLPKTAPAANGKPVGFQALEVQYEQRGDADPNEPSNWDA